MYNKIIQSKAYMYKLRQLTQHTLYKSEVPRTSLRSVIFSYLPKKFDTSLQSLRPFFPQVTADKLHPIHFQNSCLVKFLTCRFPPPFDVKRFFIQTASFIFSVYFSQSPGHNFMRCFRYGDPSSASCFPRPPFPQISYSRTHVA